MKFTLIDINNWERKEYFNHYRHAIPCTCNMTVKLDITTIKQQDKHLYSTLLFRLTEIINRHEEFRTNYNPQGELGIYDRLIPSYTVFNPETETFTSIWTEPSETYADFYQSYQQDLAQYGKNKGLIGKPDMPENTFNVSMIPWTSFEGFNLNLEKGFAYLLPIFTFGKYEQINNRYIIPMSVQIHHAVCDGFHVCRLINELQTALHQEL